MRCIFCLKERQPSVEHVFSLAIGGTITTDRVCGECNSALGSRVDSALNNFLPIRIRRAELALTGNSRDPPSIFEMFLGDQQLVGPAANRIQTSFNKATGTLDHRQLYHAADLVTSDGKKVRQITLDQRDKGQIPKIIQRERKRQGLPPLSSEELAIEAGKATLSTIERPLIQVNVNVRFAFLRQAMMKIAYELAFVWLGESYLDDPMSLELRHAILMDDITSSDMLPGYVGWAEPCPAFNFWIPHRAHHLAFSSVVDGSVIVAARVFDIFAVAMPVSRNASRYVDSHADAMNLPFLAIDTANKRTVKTTLGEEQHRIAREMTKNRRPPPFPDPL